MPLDGELEMDIPWPKPDDELFKTGQFENEGSPNLAAYVFSKRMIPIADGYKDAGDALVKWLEDSDLRNDFLVYPIVFCYRQHVELQLKYIIQIINAINQNPEQYRRTHSLLELWNTLRSQLGPEIVGDEQETFDVVGRHIKQFNEIDPESITFRYPASIPFNQVDLGNLKSVMASVSKFLGSLADYIEATMDAKL